MAGARRGDLLNLWWRDVDLDGASIQIKGSASFIAGERIKGTTKSGRSRVVSIAPGTPGHRLVTHDVLDQTSQCA